MVDEPQFAEFVRNRAAALYRYGFMLTGNHHDADDLVQDALIKLHAHWNRVVRKEDPTGFVRTTMARLNISVWRRRHRELPSPQVPEQARTDTALARAEENDYIRQIAESLRALPPRQRTVLVLRYYEQLSDEEIGATLGVSRGTVRSQAARGLDKLRTAGIKELADELT
ncbi:SigE family RNA polymerase sigma factor [Micromonospora sp. HUAS LYJ1]|uniref:SigE family RNA polymerase sigma factor n=1 Tax=Micromonospora sp. HUAS LYJ1 TaxID=3061626 RepID=UPI002674137E|nr:SigE family RNA polymerase sigma factor [Micromonospora sp. HUAS LYJ1]WKU05356.1 SigE family RNA polymerase sigma factor [Micromonospora sp. HUAS LYJ1]